MGSIQAKMERSWIELNIQNLKHNVKILTEAIPPECELMAVVKAEAYGHGACKVSTILNKMGIKAFAVATVYVVPPILVFLYGEDYLVEGITYQGGIKG